MHITFEKLAVLQCVGQFRQGYSIGLEPLFGMFPTRRHFALRRKVHHILGFKRVQQFDYLGHISIQVHLVELEIRSLMPLVRQEQSALLWRATDANNLISLIL